MSFEFQDYHKDRRTPYHEVYDSGNNLYSSDVCPYYSPYNDLANTYEREKGLASHDEAIHGHLRNFTPPHHSYTNDDQALQHISHDAGFDPPTSIECREQSYNYNVCHYTTISDKTYDMSNYDRYVNGQSHFQHVHEQGINSYQIIIVFTRKYDYEIIKIMHRINLL